MNQVYVKTPDGNMVLCNVIEIVPSSFTLLELVCVKALQGYPFDGRNKAVVSISNIYPSNNTEEKTS